MRLLQKTTLFGVALALAVLAGCESMPQNQGSNTAAAAAPPTVTQSQAAQPAPAQQQTGQQQAQAAAIPSFFLAQEQQAEGLVELKFADGSLWAAPTAVLTRVDLGNVEPRRTRSGQAYVRFGFNEQGVAKLAQISQRFAGKLLIVALGNDVVGLVRVPETSGQALDVSMPSDERAVAVADAVIDGGQEQPTTGQPAAQ